MLKVMLQEYKNKLMRYQSYKGLASMIGLLTCLESLFVLPKKTQYFIAQKNGTMTFFVRPLKNLAILLLLLFPSYLNADSFNVANLSNKCSRGYIPACISLAKDSKAKHNKEELNKYQEKIIATLQHSCQKEYKACLALAEIYNPHVSKQAKQLDQKNLTQQAKPDSLNNHHSEHLSNIEQSQKDFITYTLSLRELGITTNKSEAAKYYEKAVPLMESACYARDLEERDLQACLVLSYFYANAIGVALNRPKGQRLVEFALDSFTRECLLENTNICVAINKYPDYMKMIASEIHHLIRKCEERDSTACFRASLYYTQDFYTANHAQSPSNSDIKDSPTAKGLDSTQSPFKDTQIDSKMDFVKSANFLQQACKLEERECENTLFKIPFAKACLMQQDMQACAQVPSDKPEFLALSCNHGDVSSCYALRHLPVFNNTRKFVALAQRACKGGIIDACGELAKRYKLGYKVTKSEEKFLYFSERACNWEMKGMKSPNGTKPNKHYCYDTAFGYEMGTSMKQDIAKATKLYQYSCAFNANSCDRLAGLYQNYQKDSQRALQLYKYACNHGTHFARSCAQVANNYLSQAIKGENTLKNLDLAVIYYQKASALAGTGSLDSYYQLGVIHSLENLPNATFQNAKDSKSYQIFKYSESNPYKNYALAAYYYKKACDKGFVESCNKYKEYAQDKQQQMKDLCDINNPDSDMPSCYQFVLYHLGFLESHSSNMDPLHIANILLQSCQRDNAQACAISAALSTNPEYQSVFKTLKIMQDIPLQERLCKASKDVRYRAILKDKDTGRFCSHVANIAYHKQDYKALISALGGYEYSLIDSLTLEGGLDKLAQAYFETRQFDKMLEVYRYLYMKKIPNSYYFLAKMYQEGLGVKIDYQKAIDIYRLGIDNQEDSEEGGFSFSQASTPQGFALSYLGLAETYEHGLGVQTDRYKAQAFLRLACPLDREMTAQNTAAKACALLSIESSKAGDLQTAKAYYQRACSAQYSGDIIECTNQ